MKLLILWVSGVPITPNYELCFREADYICNKSEGMIRILFHWWKRNAEQKEYKNAIYFNSKQMWFTTNMSALHLLKD